MDVAEHPGARLEQSGAGRADNSPGATTSYARTGKEHHGAF
jgi:hypothetical protein